MTLSLGVRSFDSESFVCRQIVEFRSFILPLVSLPAQSHVARATPGSGVRSAMRAPIPAPGWTPFAPQCNDGGGSQRREPRRPGHDRTVHASLQRDDDARHGRQGRRADVRHSARCGGGNAARRRGSDCPDRRGARRGAAKPDNSGRGAGRRAGVGTRRARGPPRPPSSSRRSTAFTAPCAWTGSASAWM